LACHRKTLVGVSKNMGGETLNLIFNLDGVICNQEDPLLMKHARPLINVTEFMQWLKNEDHHITIWCERENTLEMKMMTESWLLINQIPYDRLLFDRPNEPVYVSDTPPNAKYLKGWGDNEIVAAMFEEWKEWITKKEQE